MKTSELTGAALDLAVAMCELKTTGDKGALIHLIGYGKPIPNYSSDWAQGGPIIEREEISVNWASGQWQAHTANDQDEYEQIEYGPTPLVAAMRCYVASKLGETVNVPEELKP
jgi:hypothetical protein